MKLHDSARVVPSHEVKDHGWAIELHARGGSLGDLLAEVGRAVAEVKLAGADCVPGGPPRPIRISAPDRGTLLSRWLGELLSLADGDRWVAMDFTIDLAEGGEVPRPRVRREAGASPQPRPMRYGAGTADHGCARRSGGTRHPRGPGRQHRTMVALSRRPEDRPRL